MTADSDERWRVVQDAIERILLARENGEAVNVLAACDGDEDLAARVRRVLGHGRGLIDDALVEEADAMPKDFGDFEVLRRIGRGGMGSVFLARQKSLGRLVALKVLAPGAIDLPSARVRLQREAAVTAALAHPNIVPVYLVGEFGGAPYIAMKFVDGPSLAELPVPLPPDQVASIGLQAARALAATHAQGVLHRDIKPGNMLLDGESPVIVDFGLARASADATLTREGVVPGTLRYMAPERLGGDDLLDPRIDVYALGATLYWLLAGRDAFAEREPSALVRAILTRDPAPLHLRGRARDLETIVLVALAKEPGRRFASAEQFAADLERYLAGEPVHSRRLSWPGRLQRRAARHPRTTTALAAATLVLAGAGVWLLMEAAATRADARQRLVAANADIVAERWEAAAATLAALHARDPADQEVAQRFAAARAQVAFDRLLMVIADRTSNASADAQTLDALTMAASGSDDSFPFAVVLATGHRHGRDAGQRALAALPAALHARRPGVALRCWLDQVPLPWQLPPAATTPASEAILVALLLRLSGHPPASVLAELARVDTGAHSQRRVLLLEAIARTDDGDPIAAEALLRGIADEYAPKPVWRWLALVQLQLGRMDQARATLARGDDSPSAEYLRLALTFAKAGDDEIRRLHESLRQRADLPIEIERFRWEDLGKRDASQRAAAIAHLAALHARQQDDPIGQDLTLAAMIETAAWHLPVPFEVDEIVDPKPHAEFLAEWLPRARELRYGPALAVACEWLAQSQCLCGSSLLAGLDRFAQAVAHQPLRARALLAYAREIGNLPESIDIAVRSTHLAIARRAIAGIEAAAQDRLALDTETRKQVAWYGYLLALHAQDAFDAARRLDQVRDVLPESMERSAADVAATVQRLRAAAAGR